MTEHAGLATRTLAFAVDAAIINAVAWAVAAVVALGLSLLKVPDAVVTAMAHGVRNVDKVLPKLTCYILVCVVLY